MADFPWIDLFKWNDGPYYGSVNTLEEANEVIDEFCYSTSTSYVETRCTKQFGKFDVAHGMKILIIRTYL